MAHLRVLTGTAMQANLSFQTRFRASRWHQCCRWVNGDLGMSPFRGQLSGRREPASNYVAVVHQSKHKGGSKI